MLRVAAAALDAARGVSPVLVHGIARGGCRTALIVGSLDLEALHPEAVHPEALHPKALHPERRDHE